MDPMRLILIAIGGYLVYRATIGKTPATAVPGATPGTTGTTTGGTTSGGTTPGTTPSSGTTSGATDQTRPSVEFYAALWAEDPAQLSRLPMPFVSGKDYVMAKGANGDTNAMSVLISRSVIQGPDQWNVYHAMGGGSAISPQVMDAYIAGDRSPISVTEYRSRLASAGLTGLSGLGTWGGVWA